MSTPSDYYGNGWWWLRSPNTDFSYYARRVYGVGYDYGSHVNTPYYGVVPALRIRLDDATEPEQDETYTRDGDYIYFGEYPQTIKANDVQITDTVDSRGYYLGADGEYYAKVTASPCDSSYTFSTGASVTSGTEYYFKVEPIRWRILEEKNGEAFILCDSIIANKRYDDYLNNYAESEIREWLNEQFYATAFNDLQKALILTTTVDNSLESTGDYSNPCVCEDTNDKLFLLSSAEVTNSAYGFAAGAYGTERRMPTSDYSRATGAGMSTGSTYYGNGLWWLRSPDYIYSDRARSATTASTTTSTACTILTTAWCPL